MGDSGGQGFLSKILNGIVGAPRSEDKQQSIRREEDVRHGYDYFESNQGAARVPQFATYQATAQPQVQTPWKESSRASQLTAEIERLRQDTDEIKKDRLREKRQLELALKIIQEKDSQINRLQEQIKRSREVQPPADKRAKSSDGSVYIISSPNVYERSDVVMGYLKRFASPASFLAPPTPKPRSNLIAASQTIKRRKEDLKTLTIPGSSTAEKLMAPEPAAEVNTFTTTAIEDKPPSKEPEPTTTSFFGGADSTAAVTFAAEDKSEKPAFGAFSMDAAAEKPKDTGFGAFGSFGDKEDKDAPASTFGGFGTTEEPSAFKGFGDSGDKPAFGASADAEDKSKEPEVPAFGGFNTTTTTTDKPKDSAFAGFGVSTDPPATETGFTGFAAATTDEPKDKDTAFGGFTAPALTTDTDKPKEPAFGGFSAFGTSNKEEITKEKEKRKLSDDDEEEAEKPTPAFSGFTGIGGGSSAFSFTDKKDETPAIPKISSFSEIAKDKPVEAPSAFGFKIANESDKPAADPAPAPAPATTPAAGFKSFGGGGGAPVEIDFEDGFASNAGSVSDDEEDDKKKEDAAPSIFASFSFNPSTNTSGGSNAFGAFGSKPDESKPSTEETTTSSTNAFGAFSSDSKTQASPFGSAFGAFGATTTDAAEPKTDATKPAFGAPEGDSKPFGMAFSSDQGAEKKDDKPAFGAFGGFGAAPAADAEKADDKPAFGGFGGFGSAPAADAEKAEDKPAATPFGGAFGAFSTPSKDEKATPFANAFGGGDASSSSGFGGFGATQPASDTATVPFSGLGGAFAAPAAPAAAATPPAFNFADPSAAVQNSPPTPFSFGNPTTSETPNFDFGGTSSTSPGEGGNSAPFAFTGGAPSRGPRKTVVMKSGQRRIR